MNVFFDLDGTLLNSKKRLYLLFKELVPKSNLTFEKYWKLKRNKINHKSILIDNYNYSEDDYINFEKNFFEKIELIDYLKHDTLVNGVYETLETLSMKDKLYIITMRQNKDNLYSQLKQFSITKYFTDILISEKKYNKTELIRMVQFQNSDFIIGDTDYDILTGTNLGIQTIAVCYGFLNKKKIIEYKPNYIVSKLPKVVSILYPE